MNETKFRKKRSRESTRGLPVLHCLRGDVGLYWFLVPTCIEAEHVL